MHINIYTFIQLDDSIQIDYTNQFDDLIKFGKSEHCPVRQAARICARHMAS